MLESGCKVARSTHIARERAILFRFELFADALFSFCKVNYMVKHGIL